MNKIKELMNKVNINTATKKLLFRFMIFLFIILIIIFIITQVINGQKIKECNKLRDKILSYTDDYMDNGDLYPTLNGTSKTIDLDLLESNIIFKDEPIFGTVTYTKYNNDYIKTVEITNADVCTTGKFKKQIDKYNNDVNTKVNVYFNYYLVDNYNSKWSSWLPSEQINTEPTDGVLLPLDTTELPKINENAIITEYVRDTKDYYSYSDKKWKWYKNNIKYSDHSSTKPNGYANFDDKTLKYTEYTDWSLDYPKEEEYRQIKSKIGYRWFKEEGKEKIYWENGQYALESPGEDYIKDKDSESRMYSYRDKMWQWYNGDTKRLYSNPSSTKPNSTYKYRDDSTLTYNDWSKYDDESRVTKENKSFREQRIDTYSRYLIKYKIRSFAMLEDAVNLSELEQILNKSYQEIEDDKSIDVDVIFKFQQEG